MSGVFRPALIRPLPITLPPFPGECESSYWGRLAKANRVSLTRLRSPSRWLESRLTSLDALSILSGQRRQSLLKAIPDLPVDDGSGRLVDPLMPDDVDARWACRCCVASRTGATFPARVWASIHEQVCIRHKLWIGDNVMAPEQQLDLTRTPDIVHAQHRHWRLLRRYGPGVLDICQDAGSDLWRGLSHRHYRLVNRAEILYRVVEFRKLTDPKYEAPWSIAAGYPEHITLTGFLTSSHWRRLAATKDLYYLNQAVAEFNRRLPTEKPLRGNSYTWLVKTLQATAIEIETRLGNSEKPSAPGDGWDISLPPSHTTPGTPGPRPRPPGLSRDGGRLTYQPSPDTR